MNASICFVRPLARSTNLEQFGLDCCHGITDPSADLRVPVLPHGVIVLASIEEGFLWVYVAFVEDGMDGNGKEVAEG